jgi:hypothetical protein
MNKNNMPEETPQTQFIVKDTNSAMKIKREERKEAGFRPRNGVPWARNRPARNVLSPLFTYTYAHS